MKIKTVVLALSMLLIAAGSVEAHKLTTATAKQKIRQQAAKECKEKNCTSITVDRCSRLSRHRVSCHAAASFRNGNGCTWVTTATASHKSSKIDLLIRDLVCSKG